MAEIDAELACADEVVTIGRTSGPLHLLRGEDAPPLLLTRSWLMQLTQLGLRLVRLEDMLWVWKYVEEEHSVFGVVRTVIVRVLVHRGAHEEFLLPEAETDRLVLWLLRRVPGIRVGYDPRLERLWLMGPEQMGELFDEIQRDRRVQEQQPPAQRETAIQIRAQDIARAEMGHRERPAGQ
jgi:hypothetical protein